MCIYVNYVCVTFVGYVWVRFIYTKIFAFIKKQKDNNCYIYIYTIYVIYVGVTFVGYIQGDLYKGNFAFIKIKKKTIVTHTYIYIYILFM